MKILITGSTGLLGQALCQSLAGSAELLGLSRHASSQPQAGLHAVCDLTDAAGTSGVVRAYQPDVVIHTQALSDVDRCELEPALARAHNVTTTAHLLEAVRPCNSLLMQLSTDYVFDGTKGAPYTEEDTPNPLSVYGRSKWDAEQLALSYPRAVIVRPSTLFGPGRMNFCEYVASRLSAQQPVEAFLDQTTSPTYTIDLAQAIGALADALWQASRLPARIYHITNAGQATRVEVAERIAELFGASRDLIRRIPMREQHRPAPRPAFSALSSLHVSRVIGLPLRSWEDALQAYFHQRERALQ